MFLYFQSFLSFFKKFRCFGNKIIESQSASWYAKNPRKYETTENFKVYIAWLKGYLHYKERKFIPCAKELVSKKTIFCFDIEI